jgi:serine/threonine protein kinase
MIPGRRFEKIASFSLTKWTRIIIRIVILSPGTRLGPYEILAPIGAGGMGEVLKARDTRLDRIVAVNVLPEHVAKREDLRACFEREARAVTSLESSEHLQRFSTSARSLAPGPT